MGTDDVFHGRCFDSRKAGNSRRPRPEPVNRQGERVGGSSVGEPPCFAPFGGEALLVADDDCFAFASQSRHSPTSLPFDEPLSEGPPIADYVEALSGSRSGSLGNLDVCQEILDGEKSVVHTPSVPGQVTPDVSELLACEENLCPELNY